MRISHVQFHHLNTVPNKGGQLTSLHIGQNAHGSYEPSKTKCPWLLVLEYRCAYFHRPLARLSLEINDSWGSSQCQEKLGSPSVFDGPGLQVYTILKFTWRALMIRAISIWNLPSSIAPPAKPLRNSRLCLLNVMTSETAIGFPISSPNAARNWLISK